MWLLHPVLWSLVVKDSGRLASLRGWVDRSLLVTFLMGDWDLCGGGLIPRFRSLTGDGIALHLRCFGVSF
jgi:hypothetical protein